VQRLKRQQYLVANFALRADKNFASDRVLQVSHDIPSLLSALILVDAVDVGGGVQRLKC